MIKNKNKNNKKNSTKFIKKKKNDSQIQTSASEL
jgi:hypothetical protein